MPREKRLVVVGTPHHITQRGNNRQAVFRSVADRHFYLKTLKAKCGQHNLRVLGYCFMTNHVHLIATPFPGTFIVDRDGRVTARFFEEFYRERNTAANIMLKLGAPLSGIAGSSGETAHLEIAASQSNPAVTLGSRFHLRLDISPKANMHVYAPGADELGYRVPVPCFQQLTDFARKTCVQLCSKRFEVCSCSSAAPGPLTPINLARS